MVLYDTVQVCQKGDWAGATGVGRATPCRSTVCGYLLGFVPPGDSGSGSGTGGSTPGADPGRDHAL
jgi:hypothetical protein